MYDIGPEVTDDVFDMAIPKEQETEPECRVKKYRIGMDAKDPHAVDGRIGVFERFRRRDHADLMAIGHQIARQPLGKIRRPIYLGIICVCRD